MPGTRSTNAGWLAVPEVLASVINDLWQPGPADGYEKGPRYRRTRSEWLRNRNNTAGDLRAVVLEQFITAGEPSDDVPSSALPPRTAMAFSVPTLTDQIVKVEGFQVLVLEDPGPPRPSAKT